MLASGLLREAVSEDEEEVEGTSSSLPPRPLQSPSDVWVCRFLCNFVYFLSSRPLVARAATNVACRCISCVSVFCTTQSFQINWITAISLSSWLMSAHYTDFWKQQTYWLKLDFLNVQSDSLNGTCAVVMCSSWSEHALQISIGRFGRASLQHQSTCWRSPVMQSIRVLSLFDTWKSQRKREQSRVLNFRRRLIDWTLLVQ